MGHLRTFVIADDHPLFRAALKDTINRQFDHPNLIEAEDIASLQSCMEQNREANLVLLDLHMPGAHGFSGLIFLNSHFPEVPVVVVSANDSPEIISRAMDHGAAGFLTKSSSPEQISEAIESVLQGNFWTPPDYRPPNSHTDDDEFGVAEIMGSLTPQQFKVATMLAEGLLNKQIAYELNVTEATIKAHLTEIFRKLGVHSRTQAVLAMSRLDVKPPEKAAFS